MVRQAVELSARWLRLAWAAPCSAVGLLIGAALLAGGGRARIERGAIEFAWRDSVLRCGALSRRLPWCAITLGHVIIGRSPGELAAVRDHEHVHVAQYERWGVLFFAAYPLASAWQWLAGRDPYRDNPFEVQARRLAD